MSILDNIINSLNGKADKDLVNCTKPHIVESYVNGTSWYRVYSDGWCEQGGFATATAAGSPQQISLLKNFINTNYSVFITRTATADSYLQVTITAQTLSNFTTGYACNKYWVACGYIS